MVLWGIMVIGACLALAGSRLAVIRVHLGLEAGQEGALMLDYGLLTLVLFGLLGLLSVLPELRTRLKRLEQLGEEEW
jgi:hypothetical protein